MPVAPSSRSRQYTGRLQTFSSYDTPISVEFELLGRQGQFTDEAFVPYSIYGEQSNILRQLPGLAASTPLTSYFDNIFLSPGGNTDDPNFLMVGIANELTMNARPVTPKKLSFNIVWYANADLSTDRILANISKVQAFMYPRYRVGFNPPLARLTVPDLYDLRCWVESVRVEWTNIWKITGSKLPGPSKHPMGAELSVTVLLADYPTQNDVLSGATFNSWNTADNPMPARSSTLPPSL
jgi:hypothetical protein